MDIYDAKPWLSVNVSLICHSCVNLKNKGCFNHGVLYIIQTVQFKTFSDIFKPEMFENQKCLKIYWKIF